MKSSSFVRHDMLPPGPAPASQVGLVRWLRENLFSGPLNTLLTLGGIAFVIWLVQAATPWLMHSVWNANSQNECREIVTATWGPDATGACWAIIRERWHQFLFGFFPMDQYWRPIVAFGWLVAALVPVLFWKNQSGAVLLGVAAGLTVLALLGVSLPPSAIAAALVLSLMAVVVGVYAPQHLIWVTLLFPFGAIWLIWGGSIWSPVVSVMGVGVALAVGKVYGMLRLPPLRIVYATFVALGAAVVMATFLRYLNLVTHDFLLQMSDVEFYRTFFPDAGLLLSLFGFVLSAIVWVILEVIWGLMQVLHWVSYALNLNLSQLVTFPFAEFLGVGAIIAAMLVFNAARNLASGIGVFGAALSLAVFGMFAHGWLVKELGEIWGYSIPSVDSSELGGFLLAVLIGVSAIAFSLPLGILLALGRQSDMMIVKTLSVGFIEFIRGVPLITLLFTASLLLQYFLPKGTSFDLILRVVILVTLFAAAYIAEVIRGGLAALPRGQYEAADALGLDYWQAQRLIIMPQALKVSIPGIVSVFIGMFKDTTLVAFVGLLDPLKGVSTAVRADIAWKGIYWEPYIFVAIIFFIFNFSMSRYSMYLERKLKRDHR